MAKKRAIGRYPKAFRKMAVELEPQQHQLLLAVRGLPRGVVATVGDLAERLQLKHHSVVELLNRLERHAYVARKTSQQDRRHVIVTLTSAGSDILRKLSLAHHEELETAGPRLANALHSLARQHSVKRKVPA